MPTLTGWVFDLSAFDDAVLVTFRCDDGSMIRLRAPFRPSFVVAGRWIRSADVSAAASAWGCDVTSGRGTDLFTGESLPSWTLRVRSAGEMPRLVRLAARAFSPEALFDADVPAEAQFAHVTGLSPLCRARVDLDDGFLIRKADILDDPREIDPTRPPLAVATLRIDGVGHPAHGPLRPLIFAFGGTTHRFEWDDPARLLRGLSCLLADADPDLVISDYGDSFLVPRLLAFATACRLPFTLDRVLQGAPPAPPRAPLAAKSYWSYGRVAYRAESHIASGRWHVDARNAFLFADTGIEGLMELSRLSGLPLQKTARSSPGTAISAMEVALARSRGVLVPLSKREPEGFKTASMLVETDKGGLVYRPRTAVVGNVAELDFASIYPSLMDRYNLSPETVDCACCPDGEPVPGIGARVCRKRRGLVPDTLAPLLEKRRALKAKQKAAVTVEEREPYKRRQTAIKWLLVVSFGFLGYRNARFGRIEAHEAVTAWGREKLLLAKETAERLGFSFLHGLTDAMWVVRDGATEGDYRDLEEAVTRDTEMPIALEGIYRWIAFLPSRMRPSVAVANRFVGTFTNGEVKARGIAMRRSDTPPVAASLQKAMLAKMAMADGPEALAAMRDELRAMVDDAAREVREGVVPVEALTLTRRLSKAPDEYRSKTAAAKAAQELAAHGVDLPPGSKIRYLLIDGGGRATGLLDGTERPDLAKYEALVRAAGDELLWVAHESSRVR